MTTLQTSTRLQGKKIAILATDGFEQSEIEEYNSISRQRRFVPSFVESYFAEQAKFVSIKEDLEEKSFEARKIRIIRPEHIDEFVETYQEKLEK